MKDEKASLSLVKIACITLFLMFFLGFGVMATSIQLNNVKIVLSNDYELEVLTTKEKVSEILKENHIIVLPEETVVPDQDSNLTQDKTIKITKQNEQTSKAIAHEQKDISMEELLEEYTPIVEKIITEQIEIPFETITKDVSGSSNQTTNKVLEEGKNGLKEITYRVKLKKESEIERTVIEEKVIEEPVNRVVQVTKKVTARSSRARVTQTNPTTTAQTSLAKKVEGKTPIVKTFNTSAYCACKSCCGKTTGITSSGAKASAWYTIAAGKAYPVGTVIYIPYFKNKPNGGWFVVQDRGGAISNNKIDIFMGTHSQALQFGRRSLECYVYM